MKASFRKGNVYFPIHNTAIIKSKHGDLQCVWDSNRTVTTVDA